VRELSGRSLRAVCSTSSRAKKKSVTRWVSVWRGVAALVAVLSGARLASARERSFALTWDAPADCPAAAAVESYVEADVGAIAFGPMAVRARGTVLQNTDGRYTVQLELDTDAAQTSTRSLDGSNCEAVSQAVALLVALAIRARQPAVVAPPAPPPPSPPLPPPVKSRPPTHERPFLAAEALADVGSLPEATIGLGVAGGVSASWLRFEPSVAYFAPRSGNVTGQPGLGAHFALGTAGARVCTPFPRAELWAAPCVGGGVDFIRATGFGARIPHNPSTFDGFVSATALGGWDISPIISLRLEFAAVMPLVRPEFTVDGVGLVYRRAAVGLRSALGLELHF
jgi:hypothetical protein